MSPWPGVWPCRSEASSRTTGAEKRKLAKMKAYHFTGDTLRDGRPIPAIGEWLDHPGPIVPCESGLHASEHPFDALQFAPGPMLHLVELDGEIQTHGNQPDKIVGRRRKIVASIDATDLLREFARWCALQVAHLWDCPPVVSQYLETGDESIRAAAWAADRDAARDADRAAARDADRDADRDAAWADARDAAWAADRAAARAAAWAAAWAADRDSQRAKLESMVNEAFKSNTP